MINWDSTTIENDIVFIAQLRKPRIKYFLSDSDLEYTDKKTFLSIYSTLKRCTSGKVYHYDSPKKFTKNLSKHSKDIVLSIWSGQKSRNRRALIPSICEANEIAYIGADAYTFSLCQDKYLTKIFCQQFNVSTPQFKLIENDNQIDIIEDLRLPIVVKPNFEGGSIGISNKNLAYSYEEAKSIIHELRVVFDQPVLVEEYVTGQEVSIVLFGNKNEIKILEVIKIIIDGVDTFQNSIYGFETKKEKTSELKHECITSEIDEDIINQAIKIFNYLDKVEILRIDGRLNKNGFNLLELTPDAYLGKDCFVESAFKHNGISFKSMLSQIIQNAMTQVQFQNARE